MINLLENMADPTRQTRVYRCVTGHTMDQVKQGVRNLWWVHKDPALRGAILSHMRLNYERACMEADPETDKATTLRHCLQYLRAVSARVHKDSPEEKE